MKFCPSVRFRLVSKTVLLIALSSIVTTQLTAETSWWHNDWNRRAPLTLSGTGLSASLKEVPVLVVLKPSRIEYQSAAPDGRDLRFVAEDQATVLPHEVERWVAGGTSYIWVRVPSVTAGSASRIWLYYGNPSAGNTENARSVWGGYRAVWHLGNAAASDATGSGRDGVNEGTTDIIGQIGRGRRLDGVNDRLRVAHSSGLSFGTTSSFTLSAWVRPESPPARWQGIVTKSRNDSPWYGLWANSSRQWVAGGRTNLVGPSLGTAWTHVAVVQDGTARHRRLYVNGTLAKAGAAQDASGTGDLWIGGASGMAEYFKGAIDEVRVEAVARSSEWISAVHRSETDRLVTYGASTARPSPEPDPAPAPPPGWDDDFGGYRPHYQGFGVKTRGGRGGAILKVTNLNDNGPGSFRAAVTASGPRFVIFEVSGTIRLETDLRVTNPFITIAGQTAPSPGITIAGRYVTINTHDVVIQHLRFRLGDDIYPSERDTLGIRAGAYNVVLDHNSLSWGLDEVLDISKSGTIGDYPRDIAILDNIISEGLNVTGHATGSLFGPNENGSITGARNLFAHHNNRFPTVGNGYSRFLWVNNVLYNATRNGDGSPSSAGTLAYALYLTYNGSCAPIAGGPIQAVHIGNVTIHGPNTATDLRPLKIRTPNGTGTFYLADNRGFGMTASNQYGGVHFQCGTTEAGVKLTSPPAWYTALGMNPIPGAAVESFVVANAGARPLDRDGVDARVVSNVLSRTGRIIDRPGDVGGHPVLAARKRSLTVPSDPHAIIDDAGRTRIEAWLEAFARDLEPAHTGSGYLSTTQK